MTQQELTTKQAEQIDAFQGEVFDLLQRLSPVELEWNIEHIGNVCDAVVDALCEKGYNVMTEMELYPYMETE